VKERERERERENRIKEEVKMRLSQACQMLSTQLLSGKKQIEKKIKIFPGNTKCKKR
jgi:hypothetical protein